MFFLFFSIVYFFFHLDTYIVFCMSKPFPFPHSYPRVASTVTHNGIPAVNLDWSSPPQPSHPCSYLTIPNQGLLCLLGTSYLCPISPFLLFQFTVRILPELLGSILCPPVLHASARMSKHITPDAALELGSMHCLLSPTDKIQILCMSHSLIPPCLPVCPWLVFILRHLIPSHIESMSESIFKRQAMLL